MNTSYTLPAFSCSTANFQGPFELLLTLAHKAEIDVRGVPLQTLIDQFQQHAKESSLDFDSKSSFAKETSWLHCLKSGLLFAQEELTSEEGKNEEAPRSLEAMFTSFIEFKQALLIKERLERRQKEQEGIARRPIQPLPQKKLLTTCDLPASALHTLLTQVIKRTAKQTLTLEQEQVVDRERALLLEEIVMPLNWRSLFVTCSLQTLIARFVALLSLIKEGYFTLDHDLLKRT